MTTRAAPWGYCRTRQGGASHDLAEPAAQRQPGHALHHGPIGILRLDDVHLEVGPQLLQGGRNHLAVEAGLVSLLPGKYGTTMPDTSGATLVARINALLQ
jgi:hypothetical protein